MKKSKNTFVKRRHKFFFAIARPIARAIAWKYHFKTKAQKLKKGEQYFIISNNGAEILKDYTNEIVFYNEALDMYVWGVTHWGTSWDYVLTDIRLNCGKEAYN